MYNIIGQFKSTFVSQKYLLQLNKNWIFKYIVRRNVIF